MTKIHIPRESGVGIRQAIPAAKPKRKLRRIRPAAPTTCGALNPERPGIVNDATGEHWVDPIYCTAILKHRDGKPVPHRGAHRARTLAGIVYRWPATKAAK